MIFVPIRVLKRQDTLSLPFWSAGAGFYPKAKLRVKLPYKNRRMVWKT